MTSFRIPHLPITDRNKLWLAVFVGMLTVLIYAVAGELASGLRPRELPLTALDRAIPLLPWTFWIYASVYCIYAFSCIFQRDFDAFGKFLYGYVFSYSLAAIFFLIFPTTFPRDEFPIDHILSGDTIVWSDAALAWFRTVDHPTNCLPSMHVASCVMSSAPFYGRRPWVFAIFCLWGLAISITTLTTKQHYAVDVVTGAAYGLLTHLLVSKWVPFSAPTGVFAKT